MAEHKKFGAAKKTDCGGLSGPNGFRAQILEEVPEVDAVVGNRRKLNE